MAFVIRYVETAEEIESNVAAVASSAGKGYLDMLGCTAEEYVSGWNDLYVCDATTPHDDIDWSLGGVEPYEALQFPTRKSALDWVMAHAATEPGEFIVEEF
jgi:hypothetical protein